MDTPLTEFSLSHLIAYRDSPAAPPGDIASNLVLSNSDEVPIHRFPVEILTEIFLMCIYAEYPESPMVSGGEPITWDFPQPGLRKAYPVLRGKNLPLRLCHICRAWRGIVINTPKLWSFFTLCFKDLIMEQTMLEAEIWLSLSQSHLLAINMELITDRLTTSESAFFSLFLNRLSRNIHRLRRVEIHLYRVSAWEQSLFAIFGDASNALQTMAITIHRSRLARIPLHELTFSPNSPLQYLYLNGVIPKFKTLSGERLEYIKIGYDSALFPYDFLHLLAACPNLVHVDCELTNSDNTGVLINKWSERISLASLEVLRLSDGKADERDIFASLYDFLHMPALKVLTVESFFDDPLPSLTRFLSHSGSQLRELILLIRPEEEEYSSSLIESLAHTPNLRKISGFYLPLTDDVVHALTVNDDHDHGTTGRHLCPELEELLWYRVRSSVNTTAQMLCSRWSAAPYKLQKVQLFGCEWNGDSKEREEYRRVILNTRPDGVALEVATLRDRLGYRKIYRWVVLT